MNKQLVIVGGGILVVLALIGVGFMLGGSGSTGQMLPVADRPLGDSIEITDTPTSPNSAVDVSSENQEIEKNENAIIVNSRAMTQAEIDTLIAPTVDPASVAGDYWYDNVSGLYGHVGREPIGVMNSGLLFPPMVTDASAGMTNVFINGREITDIEVAYLTALFNAPVPEGLYWLEANGNYGVQGDTTVLGNLAIAAGGSAGGGTGDNFWSAGNYSAGNYNDQGQGYVSVPGYGAYGYGF